MTKKQRKKDLDALQDQMDSYISDPEYGTSTNAGWRLQFRFAVHVF